ncbi:MAG: hypothetical protein A3B70_02170 [Deltaproteobacteria bacterium RIFCSPHIGHO2_02_FULL_40_11]|nr:MAG: hypothetical protein A3B70_02170 [Deltaproteobacteria bacterium RIFCSPHIGHO2_02_FULL_40_11]
MKKGILGALLLIFWAVTAQAVSVTTIVKSIKRSGGNFGSIQKAIDAIPKDLVTANQSWILEIQDESMYVEPVVIEKITDPSHTLTFRSASLSLHPILLVQRGIGILIKNTSHVTIDGLRILGYGTGSTIGIRVENSDDVTLQHMDVLGLYVGIQTRESDSAVIAHNDVHSCQYGIYVDAESNHTTVEDNTIYHSIVGGLTLSTASHTKIRHNQFFNNSYALFFTAPIGFGNSFTDNVLQAGELTKSLIYSINGLPQQFTSNFNVLHAPNAPIAQVKNETFKNLNKWQSQGQDQDSSTQNPNLENQSPEMKVATVTKTVGNANADFKTITEALNAVPKNLVDANESWIIEIQDSRTYEEPLDLYGFHTSPSHTLTLRAKEGEIPILRSGQWDKTVSLLRMQYVTLEGLTIDAGKTAWGIRLWGSRFCTIKKCHIFNAVGSGVSLIASHSNVIVESRIHHNQRGIELIQNSSRNRIEKNWIYRSRAGCGIYLSSATMNVIQENVLFHHNTAIAFYSDVGTHNKFTSNIIVHDLKRVGISMNGPIPEGTLFDTNTIYMPEGYIGSIRGIFYRTPEEWQALGFDRHSEFTEPHFISTEEGAENFTLNPAKDKSDKKDNLSQKQRTKDSSMRDLTNRREK